MKVTNTSLKELIASGTLDANAITRIEPYLKRIKSGYPVDIRTPFWDGEDRSSVVSKWEALMSELCNDWFDELCDLETEQLSKIGPYSIQAPLADRMTGITSYWGERDFQPIDAVLWNAVRGFHEEMGLRKGSLRQTSIHNASERQENQTNSGLPYFTKRVKSRAQDAKIAEDLSFDSLMSVLGWRGQAAGIDSIPKQRTVWMYPQSINIAEGRIFYPLHNEVKKRSAFAAWIGPDEVDRRITDLLSKRHTIFSTDFSGYDQSVGKDLQQLYFNYCREIFRSDLDNIDAIGRAFETIPLLISNDSYITGSHGVPSGSLLTNQLDSFVHRIAQHYVAEWNGSYIYFNSQVQGDDGALLLPGVSNVEQIIQPFRELGLEMNPEKQHISDTSVRYLQRLHSVHWKPNGIAVGVYPFSRALNSLLGSERWRNPIDWPDQFWSIRAIMILENCKNHPSFHDLIEFTAKGDIYDLGRKYPGGIRRMLSKKNVDAYVSQPGAYPSYNEERIKTSIYEFATVQYLIGA